MAKTERMLKKVAKGLSKEGWEEGVIEIGAQMEGEAPIKKEVKISKIEEFEGIPLNTFGRFLRKFFPNLLVAISARKQEEILKSVDIQMLRKAFKEYVIPLIKEGTVTKIEKKEVEEIQIGDQTGTITIKYCVYRFVSNDGQDDFELSISGGEQRDLSLEEFRTLIEKDLENRLMENYPNRYAVENILKRMKLGLPA